MRTVTLASVLAVSSCGSQPPPNMGTGATAERELRDRVAHYYQDMSARRWPAYRAYFWPHATLTTVWQPPGEVAPRVVITSIEAFLAGTATGPDSKPIFEERLLSQDVRVSANLAHVWAHYQVLFGDSTAVATWRGFDAFTWMRQGNEWRIVAVAYTDEPGQRRGAP